MQQEKEMSFIDHLEELRWHIIRATIAIVSAALIAFIGKDILFDILIFGPTKADFFTIYSVELPVSWALIVFVILLLSLKFKVERWLVSFRRTFGPPLHLALLLHSLMYCMNFGNLSALDCMTTKEKIQGVLLLFLPFYFLLVSYLDILWFVHCL